MSNNPKKIIMVVYKIYLKSAHLSAISNFIILKTS